MDKRKCILPLALFSFFISYLTSEAQITVNSVNGYSVTIEINPISIEAPITCTWGYNYNVNFNYDATFSGSNIPSSLWTLQGSLTCGSDGNFFGLPNDGGNGSVTSSSNPYRSIADCESATPSSLGCNSGTIQIQAPGIPNQTIPFSISVLPIELVFFRSQQSGRDVILNWQTATEINNDYFTIEKSYDGLQFEELSTINSQGNASIPTDYRFIDKNVNQPTYYRLSQTDFDGSRITEGIVFQNVKNSQTDLSIFPNPNHTNQIRLSKKVHEHGIIAIYTLDGRLLFQKKITNQTGIQPELKPGQYLIQWISDSGNSPKTMRYIQH